MKRTWKVFRTIWMIVTPLLLAASLAFNLLIMAGGAAFDVASSAFETVTGKQSVATHQANEKKKLNKHLADQKRQNRELRTKVASLSEDLAAQKLVAKKFAEEKMIVHKGKRTTAKAAVLATTSTISKRAAATASRSAGSVVGEAIPYAGTAVIVGVTALELYDLCETIKDMNALSRAFDPSLEPDANEATVCSMQVPSGQEIWAAAKKKPSEAMSAARAAMPSFEELKAIEMPQIDWESHFEWTQSSAQFLYEQGVSGVSFVWDRGSDGVSSIWTSTTDGTADFKDWLQNWWSDGQDVSGCSPYGLENDGRCFEMHPHAVDPSTSIEQPASAAD